MASRFRTPLRTDDAAAAAAVAAIVRDQGAADAAKALGMRRETVLALTSGERCTPGTYALARERLAQLERLSAPALASNA